MQSKFVSRAALPMLAILLVAIIGASQVFLKGWRLDLTENQLYTLSDGTKSVLRGLEEPVNLYFFFSEEQARNNTQLAHLQTFGNRVRELLEEMQQAANGKLRLEIIDPAPFSEDEDRAETFDIQAAPINNLGDTFYLGIAGTNALADTQTIKFLQPENESQMEYELTKLIYQLGQLRKPTIGVMSSIDIKEKIDPRNGQKTPGWLSIELLAAYFDVVHVEAESTLPDDLDMLILVHPANFSDATLFELDQYVLGGGHLMAFVDPHSEYSQTIGGDQMLEGADDNLTSELNKLLEKWGVTMLPGKVAADPDFSIRYRGRDGQEQYHIALLQLPADRMNQDDPISKGMEVVNIGFSGVLEPVADSGIEVTPLISTSDNGGQFESWRIQPDMNPAMLLDGFKSTGSQILAARLHGPAKTAFPEGRPKADEAEADAAEATPALTESKGPINVVVFADTDFLSDRYWVNITDFMGEPTPRAFAANFDMVRAAAGNLTSSSDLLAIKPRDGYARPFERVDALRREADTAFRSKQEELQKQLRDVENRLAELLAQGSSNGGTIQLTDQDQEQIETVEQRKIEVRKELRNVQHQLDSEIEKLGGWLRFWNIAFIPLLLTLLVIVMALSRRAIARQKLAA